MIHCEMFYQDLLAQLEQQKMWDQLALADLLTSIDQLDLPDMLDLKDQPDLLAQLDLLVRKYISFYLYKLSFLNYVHVHV